MISFIRFCITALCLGWPSFIFSADYAEFTFNVKVLKNTCNIAIDGTSENLIDFGSIPLKKLSTDANNGNIKQSFQVRLLNCKNNNFSGNYIKITGNFINDGYLDNPKNQNFAVRISDKDGAKSSDDVFFSDKKNKLWTNISDANLTKTFYTYVMCKNGIPDCSTTAENLGQFKATITMTYLAD